nr:MAG TPA: Replication initiation and membrane attachment [Caudoviricetes sp.]
MGKRYWWLKLQEDFFRQVEIKKLRKIAGGDTYTVIYLKMMLLSLKSEGHIAYYCPENEFIENLALDIDEDEENVSVTVAFLRKHNLLVESDFESDVSLPKAAEAIGSETAVAERVRKHREKMKALQCNTAVTDMKQLGNVDIEKEKERELELELEKNKNQNTATVGLSSNYRDSLSEHSLVVVDKTDNPFRFWNSNMGALTGYIAEKIQAMIADYSEPVVLEAMQRSLEQGKRTLAYVEGCCKNIHSGNDRPRRSKQAQSGGGGRGNRDLKEVAAEVDEILAQGGAESDAKRDFDAAVWGVWASE